MSGASAPARILLVDDDQDVLDSVEAVLVSEGYQVTTASDARRALRAYAREGADAVILDIMMPGLSGLAVLRGLRRIGRGALAPVVVFSGYPDLVAKALRQGARTSLQKPCDIGQLLAVVAHVLGG